jgi:hypothetical protein
MGAKTEPLLSVSSDFMVGLTELESVTSCVSSRRSNQLSYKPKLWKPIAN